VTLRSWAATVQLTLKCLLTLGSGEVHRQRCHAAFALLTWLRSASSSDVVDSNFFAVSRHVVQHRRQLNVLVLAPAPQ
jgi:hypothetical protein